MEMLLSNMPFELAEGMRRRLGAFLSGLLAAPDIQSFADEAASYLRAEGLTGVLLGWRIDGGELHIHDPDGVKPLDTELALEARQKGSAMNPETRRVACRVSLVDGRYALGLMADGGEAELEELKQHVVVLGPLAAAIFERALLKESMAQLAHSEKLQSALFAIADMASSEMDLNDMLREMHGIVGSFMYAQNFYIALFDEQQDALRFIYLKDTTDPLIRDANEFIPMSVMEGGLTWHVIRDRMPLMGSMEAIKKQISGPTQDIGMDCYDWLGVPVVIGEKVRGVLVVQSYVERPRYTAGDQALLAYVGSHILTAVDRKLAQEELERRVDERTHALQRSVRIQETLYRIAEISHTATNLDEFFVAVHTIVADFLDARNFYIATVSDDGDRLNFPYFVDQFGTRSESRAFGKGMSEFLIRRGSPWRVDAQDPEGLAEIDRLLQTGELERFGHQFEAWLGVPLTLAERVVGVLVVQSYTPGVGYTDQDQEVLTFISYQIANGMERQRAAVQLKSAYVDLEQRVEDRTVELSEQIRVREGIELQLKHQVLHDSLTGLPNREYLRDQITRALVHRQRYPDYRFAVLFMDLDRFKVINDSVGHLVGDALLKEVAQRFTRCVRGGRDMVARLGGDEFAILMDLDNNEGAMRMAKRIIEALGEPVRVQGKELFTGVSVGIALSSPAYTTPEDLLRDADIAMYRAKSGGRHRFELFDEQLHDEALLLLETEGDLRRGMTRNEFVPYFQPIVRLVDGSIVGYEALMRWNHPERGVLAPAAFMAVAEASGSMEALDWQVFELSMRWIPQLLEPGQYINLNLTPRHFRSADLDTRFLDLIHRSGVLPAQVRIEITEGALLENPEQVGRVFARLSASGVLVALDDFGTGYSSLSYLHRFQMHTLKIDRSFISDLQSTSDGRSTAVVRAILALSQSQEMEVVAEGIETEDQRLALMALGCELGQGYFFARPQAVANILAARGGMVLPDHMKLP